MRARSPTGPALARRLIGSLAAAALGVAIGTGGTGQPDPRPTLAAGYLDAEAAAYNMRHLANSPRQEPFDGLPGDFAFANSDLAFSGDHAFVGNFAGIQVYDVSDPSQPRLTTAIVCPTFAGQHDVSVLGDLLFVSSESFEATVDCGGGTDQTPFAGVRVFDIRDLADPVQVAAVQTCRGSHTHTLVTDPDDEDVVYVYNSGTSPVRSAEQGCSDTPATNPDTDRWLIEVIEVPLAAPERARVVNEVRLFEAKGSVAGLQDDPPDRHPSGESWELPPLTDGCHDITSYPDIGLAAGACQGNGLLIDISDPADPVRLDAVADPNFAYWHSATFNNDGTKVVFTDEWGGGLAPRCRESDPPQWGGDAIFDIVDGRLRFASYHKLPAAQGEDQNCVAHNGSLVPIPNRDVLVQAWYQGGMSVVDFTDSERPVEIAYFDRGPVAAGEPLLAGAWSAYYWNGHVYSSEIARGLDVLELLPSHHVTQNELDAADTVRPEELNAQHQQQLAWSPSFALVRAHLDQAARGGVLPASTVADLTRTLDAAEEQRDAGREDAAASALRDSVRQLDPDEQAQQSLLQALEDLAGSL